MLALVVLGGLVRAMIYAYTNGFLPQPFFYQPYDLWMDWFNTADWAHDRGTYDTWGTIYPPLSFVFLNMTTLPGCYIGGSGSTATAFYARECDWLGKTVLHLFYVINIYLIGCTYWKIDRTTALPRAFALAAGLPMVSALERGNLIIVTFTCVLLAFGPLLRSARGRWLAMGMAINFKLYLIAALFPQLLRRRWRWFEGALLSTIIIYIVSFCLLGRGTPGDIADNVIKYATGAAGGLLDMWYAVTYSAALSLLNGATQSDGTVLPITALLGSNLVDTLLIVLPAVIRTVQLTLVAAAVMCWLRPEAVPMFRMTSLGLMLALITSESGGYAQALIVFFVFMERWRGFGAKWAIVMCYILCFQFDFATDVAAPPLVLETYFDGGQKIVTFSVMIGSYIRPAFVLTVVFAIGCATIRTVWSDIAKQGWKDRWRFRRDLPIMVGFGDMLKPLKIGLGKPS